MQVYGSWIIHGVIFFYTLLCPVYNIGSLYCFFIPSSAPWSVLMSPYHVPTPVLGLKDSYAY